MLGAHQPEVEIVADATLSSRTDPWLDGHRVDGLTLPPAVVGLEAMAQAASAVAGRALTTAERVRFDRPIVIPADGERVLRVCALRDGDTIFAVLRSAESGFDVDHFRAEFPLSPRTAGPMPDLVPDRGRIEPGELYGRLLFQSGPFRRVVDAAAPDPWSCRATVTLDDGDPWFTSVLGDPAAHDATIHVLQACVPARRLLPVGCDRVEMSPHPRGPWRLRGVERHAEDGHYLWDVLAEDAEGRLAVRWTGLKLADSGPLPDDRPWSSSLLSILVTRTAVALGLDRSLRVTIGEPFTVDVAGDCPATGAWEPVGPRSVTSDESLLRVMEGPCAESRETLATRASVISRCLEQRNIPPSAVEFSGVYDGGWLVLRAGDARIASAVVPVAGCPHPVALAILTARGTP
ncbi:polyketide synthase dehydratase domain-containing protein [Amycolatopsis speibonae]|uniref:Polyketide synthase dehydratase domain-containing protein n=1 Tax=Amycolatopsis speibonae TaxID=1450224 RepID=A0ABV7P2E6_9PSEU